MGYILTGDSIIKCPHGGDVRHSSEFLKTTYIHGSPICVMDDNYDILSIHSVWGNLRCAKVEWQTGSV